MLKAAYGLFVRERRRYFRCPVLIQADVRRAGVSDIRCQTVDISQGGMAMSTPVPLKYGLLVTVPIHLPSHPFQFALQSVHLLVRPTWSRGIAVRISFGGMEIRIAGMAFAEA